MKSTRIAAGIVLAVVALSAFTCGCSRIITAQNAAPNMTPAENRQAMIDWHKQHDQKPGAAAPGR